MESIQQKCLSYNIANLNKKKIKIKEAKISERIYHHVVLFAVRMDVLNYKIGNIT